MNQTWVSRVKQLLGSSLILDFDQAGSLPAPRVPIGSIARSAWHQRNPAVEEVAEALAGRLDLRSDGEGKGSAWV